MPGPTTVAVITRYPVKGCGGEDRDEIVVGPQGLVGDRALAVVVDGRIVTQREFPVLARVRPGLVDAEDRLTLRLAPCPASDRAPGSPDGDPAPPSPDPVAGGLDRSGPARSVTLFGDPVPVVEQDAELSAWFTDLLGVPATLVGAAPGLRRVSPGAVEGRTLLSDEGSVSVLSRASVADLGDRLGRAGAAPVPADRFRANLLLQGCGAHAEDAFERMQVGAATLGFATVDARCAVTTVDQSRGTRAGPEPLRTLATYRRSASGEVVFGVYAAVLTSGRVSVGDPVRL